MSPHNQHNEKNRLPSSLISYVKPTFDNLLLNFYIIYGKKKTNPPLITPGAKEAKASRDLGLFFTPRKIAILIDGAFLTIKLKTNLKRYPNTKDIIDHCDSLLKSDHLKTSELFRIYYYDALPYEKAVIYPINNRKNILAEKHYVCFGKKLIESLELQPHFAVRKGKNVNRGWKLGRKALESICRGEKDLKPNDIVPDIQQKTVDLKIGLDIAWLSVKHIVDTILLITGDSDFVPAMKFARKEGIKIYLNTLNHPVNRELKVHSDLIVEI